MKAEELRIGNWINTIKGNSQVIDIMCDCVNTFDVEGFPLSETEPIQLTEWWLIKFGFSEFHNGWTDWYEVDGLVLRKENYEYHALIESTKERYEHEYLTHIAFLHQLQNLYYALTGKELKLKS